MKKFVRWIYSIERFLSLLPKQLKCLRKIYINNSKMFVKNLFLYQFLLRLHKPISMRALKTGHRLKLK